jgi:CubicO group peptidase (beta-lactamase class C family)
MSIKAKLSLTFAAGLLICVALIFLITDRLSTFSNLYNFATFAGMFFGGTLGLTLFLLLLRKLGRPAGIERSWLLDRLYRSSVVMILVLLVLGFASYDFTTPRPVPFGDSYHYTYVPPAAQDDGWEVSTLQAEGVDSEAFNRLIERIVNDQEIKRIHSLLLVRSGKLVAEEYFYDYDRDRLHDMRSATKSLTSLLVGIAIDREILSSVDEKVYGFFPAYSSFANWDERKREITIRQLLTMSPGLACNDWSSDSPGQEGKMYRSDDWVKFILDLPLSEVKESRYCTGGAVILGAILEQASQRSFEDLAYELLFEPLGIDSYVWQHTPSGRVDSGGHLKLRPRDMAKIGSLILNRGTWQGRRIVSESWIEESMLPHTSLPEHRLGNPEYGYLWWRIAFDHHGEPTPAIQAMGNGGQFILAFPELELVAVLTGGNYGHSRMLKAFHLVSDEILPAVKK